MRNVVVVETKLEKKSQTVTSEWWGGGRELGFFSFYN